MADNTTLNTGTGGDTLRDKDRAGIKTQIVGLDIGIGSGTETLMTVGQAAMAASIPVVIASNQSAVPVSVADGANVTLGAQADAAATTDTGTFSLLALFKRLLSRLTAFMAQLPAALTGSGNLKVSLQESNASQAVTGTFWQATQPVSVAATVTVDTELPAASALTDNLANPTAPAVGACLMAFDGTAWDRVRTGSATGGELLVYVSNAPSVTCNQGTTHWDCNVTQINGVTTSTGNGISGTGVQRVTLASDSTGQVVLAAGTAVIGHVIVDSGTVTTVSTVTSLTQFNGNAISTNSGNKDAGTLRVVLATDQPTLSNAQPVSQSGTWNVGTVTTVTTVTNDVPAKLIPQTSGGTSGYSVISSGAANQDAASVKGSAGQLYGYSLFNTTSSARYVKLYNKASAPTSSDTPVVRIYLPPTGGANRDYAHAMAFGTGLAIRITTGSADNDTGACSTGDVLANLEYK
jgi:hypothetical protein